MQYSAAGPDVRAKVAGMAGAAPMVADLRAESDELDALVADLPAARWAESTPSPGWTIAHQIAHLLWTDRVALIAVTDEAAFAAGLEEAAKDPVGFVDAAAEELAPTPPADLLADWRRTRGQLHDELLKVADGRKVPWFGPPMSAASMATARLMETWAHGLDVADALGVHRPATARLRSIAHIGVRTRDFAFTVNGLTPPADPFLVQLRAPDGSTWEWGPPETNAATQRVTGSALDFCMLVTQRRPRSELDVTATGADAEQWLDIAQAFAGPPGQGR
jgi:uncharacterized protein (TIGR03084 family)